MGRERAEWLSKNEMNGRHGGGGLCKIIDGSMPKTNYTKLF
jgi:hypothetical protein